MVVFIVIVIIIVALLFGYYVFRSHEKNDMVSLYGFLDFYGDIVSKIGKKDTNRDDVDWDYNDTTTSSTKSVKTRVRKVSYSKYVELENQYKLLAEEKKGIEARYRSSEDELQSRIDALTDELRTTHAECAEFMKKTIGLMDQNTKLKEVTRKLYPVSEEKVSRPFCQYFYSIDELVHVFFKNTINMLDCVRDNNHPQVNEALVSFVNTIHELNDSAVIDWINLLSAASAVTAEAAVDMEQKNDEEAFDYLIKVSFEWYFRPLISSVLFLAEYVRENLLEEARNQLSSIINEFLDALRSYDIDVVYYKAGDVLTDSDYNDLEIKVPDVMPVTIAHNSITKVIKYGVNLPKEGCVGDKTIVEMPI